mgnify:FL=1|tara:strand:+ start:420 stop:1574 length:1155 start_codon:yes stop_codon:yes gene_type:complete
MARILTRPMFRKGGLSQTPRPSYRGGGMPAIRPRYRRGGMSGIMSGIVPKYELGGRARLQEGSSGIYPVGGKFHRFAESPVGGSIMYGIPGALADTFYTPINQLGRLFGFNPGLSARREVRAQKDLLFGKDREGRQSDEEVNKSSFIGIPFKAKSWKQEQEEKKIEKEKNKINVKQKKEQEQAQKAQSDLESIQDYMKMFEAAGASDPKSKWLELAKFGSNILAQPGGDLTGAIGKAATSSIEGLSKAEAERKAARLMGLKVGVDQVGGGEIGKKIRTLSRLTGVDEKKIARKFISGDSDFDKEYLAAAEAAGVELGQARKIYLKSIKVMADKNPDIAARLNKPFPKKNPVEGEYYVLPNGKFTRWVKGEKLKPSDPGFYDEEA